MASRGTLSNAGPGACPFVALELDRDRRAERPDYRHRCYAEQVPAPRTIAHQERYCLSPNFSGCPIFQDWAVRAAARPVPLPPGHEGGRRAAPDPRGTRVAGAGAMSMAATEMADAAGDRSAVRPTDSRPEEGWPDSMATSLPPVQAAAAAEGLAAEPIDEQQLSAFDAQPFIDSAGPTPHIDASPPAPAVVTPTRAPMDRTPTPETPAYDSDPIDLDEPDAAAVPAFLAGRSSRPPRSQMVDDGVAREDVVPSWEVHGRFGAHDGREPRGDGAFTRLLTIAAVIVILALGVLAVILIPGLLSGSPQQTTRPSVLRTALPTASLIAVLPTASPLPLATPSPITEPTTAATPGPSPMSYKIKAGDTLAKIARRNGITVDDIMAANPQISDPNDIQVGQRIVIPIPAASPPP